MKLNALLKTLGFLALAATPVVAGTMAPVDKNPIAPPPADDDLGINASLGYDTNYVFRGVNHGSHWVRSAVEGSILLIGGAGEDGAGSTSLNWDAQFGTLAGDQDSISGNIARLGTTAQADASFQRLQLGAAIAHDFGPATISVGYRYYRNMGDAAQQSQLNVIGSGLGMNDTQEVNLGLSTSLGPIDIASSAVYDITNNGWYFDATASTTVAITDSISFVPSVNVGYAKNYSWQLTGNSVNILTGGGAGLPGTANGGKNDYSGWASANVSFAFPVKLNSRATLTPYIAANLPFSGLQNVGASYRNNANALGGGSLRGPDSAFKSLLYGGVTLNIRF